MIRIQCVRTKYNAHEIDEFVNYWMSRACVNDVRISNVMNRKGDSNQSEYSVGYQTIVGRVPCASPRQRLVFSDKADNAFPCCHAWDESYPLGNIQKQTLMDIWNGEPIKRLRKLLNESKHDSVKMCKFGTCAAKETYVFSRN